MTKIKLDEDKAVYVYRYLASVSIWGLMRDRVTAKLALYDGEIEKLSK